MEIVRESRRVIRQLLHERTFAAAAIGTLTLGIAAPTALFTIVHATLVRPLPYPRAEDVYTVRTTMTDGRFTSGLVATEELGALSRATSAVAVTSYSVRFDDTLVTAGQPRQLAGYGVSQPFFDLFGLPMAAGRGFTPEDFAATGQQAGGVRRVVLSYQLWTNAFGADPKVLGSTQHLATMGSVIVVGVAPASFDMPHGAEMWFGYPLSENVGHALVGYVRLQRGTSLESLQGPSARVFDDLAKKYPDQEQHRAFVMKSLVDELVGDLGPTVLIAFAATGLLLLLALFNVANLLLARGAARARDVAVRTALGATRWHLVRQLLVESLVMSAAATVIALGLASAAVRVIVAVGGSRLPRVEGMTLNPIVFVFAAAVMIVAGVIVGLVPALTIGGERLAPLMNETSRAGLQGRRTRRWLDAMVIAEVTLAIALVAGAGRLILSLGNLLHVDPGFTSEGRLAVDVMLPFGVYRDQGRRTAWTSDAENALRSLGATRVGAGSTLPMRREWDSTIFADIVGRPTEPQNRPNARARIVNGEFFGALGIKTLLGRTFTSADRSDTAPVVVVNDAWRRRFLPGLDPLREHVVTGFFRRPGSPPDGEPADIIGVVADVQFVDLMRSAEPTLYVVDAQVPLFRRSLVVTTADGHPERLTSEIRAALTRLDPNVPIDIELMSSSESPSVVWSRLGLFLMGTCGFIAVCLAWVGVFGVVGYAVTQRTGEMAVRLALGATRSKVFALIVSHGARLAAVGLVAGVALAWWLGQLMTKYVYHVSAANLAVLGGSAALIVIVTFMAVLPPATRASAVKPGRVFRA